MSALPGASTNIVRALEPQEIKRTAQEPEQDALYNGANCQAQKKPLDMKALDYASRLIHAVEAINEENHILLAVENRILMRESLSLLKVAF